MEPASGEPLHELVEFLLVFAGEDSGFGAQAADEGVEADASLPSGVLEPVDFFALLRLAFICLIVAIVTLSAD
jgi:hypothetical protein